MSLFHMKTVISLATVFFSVGVMYYVLIHTQKVKIHTIRLCGIACIFWFVSFEKFSYSTKLCLSVGFVLVPAVYSRIYARVDEFFLYFAKYTNTLITHKVNEPLTSSITSWNLYFLKTMQNKKEKKNWRKNWKWKCEKKSGTRDDSVILVFSVFLFVFIFLFLLYCIFFSLCFFNIFFF